MTKSHRTRGVATERLLVTWLRLNGHPQAERSVRTGYRTSARELPDRGDVDGTPGIAWQVKALRPATAAEAAVPAWMVETEQQRVAAQASIGVLVVRRDGHLPGRWWAFLPAVDFLLLAGGMNLATTPVVLGDQLDDDDRARTPLMPVRLELRDLNALLRGWGLGDPLDLDTDRPEVRA